MPKNREDVLKEDVLKIAKQFFARLTQDPLEVVFGNAKKAIIEKIDEESFFVRMEQGDPFKISKTEITRGGKKDFSTRFFEDLHNALSAGFLILQIPVDEFNKDVIQEEERSRKQAEYEQQEQERLQEKTAREIADALAEESEEVGAANHEVYFDNDFVEVKPEDFDRSLEETAISVASAALEEDFEMVELPEEQIVEANLQFGGSAIQPVAANQAFTAAQLQQNQSGGRGGGGNG